VQFISQYIGFVFVILHNWHPLCFQVIVVVLRLHLSHHLVASGLALSYGSIVVIASLATAPLEW